MKLTPANCRVEREASDTHGSLSTGASSGLLRRRILAILKHEGCSWPMQDGRMCGEPVEWTCGGSLKNPRLYCDPHGSFMNQRMVRTRKLVQARAARKRKAREKVKKKVATDDPNK